MAPFPKTEIELQLAGYKYTGKGLCRGCERTIEWWLTPKNAKMPLDPGTKEPHWGTCEARDQFKKPKAKAASASEMTERKPTEPKETK